MRLGTYEANTSDEDINKLFEALKSLGSNGVGVIGGLTKIELLQPKNNSPEPFEKIIQHCNAEISKAITGQSGTSEGGDKTSYASMRILNGVREDIAHSSLEIISNAVNEQLIKPLVSFNFDTTNYPTLELVLPDNVEQLLAIDQKFKNLGINFTKEYFTKRYNLDDSDFDIAETNQLFNNLLENDKQIQALLKKKALISQTEFKTPAVPFF
jgi:hypothetical protein